MMSEFPTFNVSSDLLKVFIESASRKILSTDHLAALSLKPDC